MYMRLDISRCFVVRGCKEKKKQEARGLHGFHRFDSCPDCRVEYEETSFWGSFGGRQGNLPKHSKQCPIDWLVRYKTKWPNTDWVACSNTYYHG